MISRVSVADRRGRRLARTGCGPTERGIRADCTLGGG